MRRWSAPGPLDVTVAEIDLRVGGKFRLDMREPDGKVHQAYGVYREIDPPQRLVYTWSWEDDKDVKDSVVTVEFHERGDATEVVLRHDGLATDKQRESHAHGWNGCLEKLESLFRRTV